jgi:histidinol dehydrogenase
LIKILSVEDRDFKDRFEELLSRGKVDIDEVSGRVLNLLNEIKSGGDNAIINHIKMFDGWVPKSFDEISISPFEMEEAYNSIGEELKEALHLAYDRIESYHRKLMPKSWIEYEKNGSMLGSMVNPVEKAGLYIPGGKASYPSSLLMNAIPAIVAGVEEIVICTPTPNGETNSVLLATCHLCGVKKVFRVGGASAIGAMAYGTDSIPKVDVITGPGNIYVATAKKLVYGDVNIDMIAGPSEIGIVADESADARWLAIDMLSQAEHDEMASSILITDSKGLADEVSREILYALERLERVGIAQKSIEERGAIIVSRTVDEAFKLMNAIAPEHLEIVTASPMESLSKVKNAGAIFLGEFTPEPIGDYIAGPNHTLPTGGTAKFYSPLSVEHFLKRSSLIMMSREGINEIGPASALLAESEGLTAHKRSVEIRFNLDK